MSYLPPTLCNIIWVFSNTPPMLYNKLKRHPSTKMTEPETDVQNSHSSGSVVNMAGEQHVGVNFFLIPLSSTFRHCHTYKLMKNRCRVTSKMRYITLTQVPPPLLWHNITKSLPLPSPSALHNMWTAPRAYGSLNWTEIYITILFPLPRSE